MTPLYPIPTQLRASSKPRDVSIDYLRATATVLVVVAHCCAPYTHLAQVLRSVEWMSPAPILDTRVSYGFDYVFSILDASVISLWFFISGLFTIPALRKKGVSLFLKDRLLRLGLPYVAMTLFLMPIAYYAAWGLAHPGGSLARFWLVDAHARFFNCPGWFLWVLLLFDSILACLYAVGSGLLPRLISRVRTMGQAPGLFAVILLLAGIVLYLPLALRYGNMWLPFVTLPFMLQRARVAFYAGWLISGVLAGSSGLGEGLLAPSGRLATRWRMWVVIGLASANLFWFGSRASVVTGLPAIECESIRAMLWVGANVGICFGLLALFRGRVRKHRGWADSLARHAYAIYVFHYVFAMWIERWLLKAALPLAAKSILSFLFTLTMSWAAAVVWGFLWNRFKGSFSRQHRSPRAGEQADALQGVSS